MSYAFERFQNGFYGLNSAEAVFWFAVLLIGVAAATHLSAKVVIGKSNMFQAIASVVMGILAFMLVGYLINQWVVALLLGAVAFAAIITLVYKAKKWGKGAAVGALAWVIFYLGGMILEWVIRRVMDS